MKKEVKRALKKLAAQTFAEIEDLRKEREIAHRRVQMFEYSVRILAFHDSYYIAVYDGEQQVDHIEIEGADNEKLLVVWEKALYLVFKGVQHLHDSKKT